MGTCPCYALFVDPWQYIVFHSLQYFQVMLPLVTLPEGLLIHPIHSTV